MSAWPIMSNLPATSFLLVFLYQLAVASTVGQCVGAPFLGFPNASWTFRLFSTRATLASSHSPPLSCRSTMVDTGTLASPQCSAALDGKAARPCCGSPFGHDVRLGSPRAEKLIAEKCVPLFT